MSAEAPPADVGVPSSLGIPTLGALAGAELRKLSTRMSARLSVLLLLLISVGFPLGMLFIQSAITRTATDGGAPPDVHFNMDQTIQTVLRVRNLFVFRALLIWVTAECVAGEIVARTLREDMVRPVRRSAVLLAKWCAMQGFVALGAVLPLALSAALGLAFFGDPGETVQGPTGFLLTWLGDAGFATMVVAIALLTRSVPGTVVGVFLYWVLDQMLGIVLWGLEQGRELVEKMLAAWGMSDMLGLVDLAIRARPWLPSAAFNVAWDYVPGEPLQWQSYVSLALLTGLFYGIAWATFARMDVE